ncbi:MAG: hypothetical protein Q8M65_09495 [Rhodoglobus sp.]|nr:hypothetical protein [Rhodoglobus sp.]
MTSWWDLALKLEIEFNSAISSFSQDLWAEDSITGEVIKRARATLNEARVDEADRPASIQARMFKADGKVEETFGDLAILIRIHFHDNQQLDGVGFYEAKRRDWGKNTFSYQVHVSFAALIQSNSVIDRTS